jgi:hypothetical protein
MTKPSIAVDLDGTLAVYDKWRGIEHIGAPIPKMVNLVKRYVANGFTVKIFTARVFDDGRHDPEVARKVIEDWCEKYIGVRLEVTNIKDPYMEVFYDDRAVGVIKNTGRRIVYKEKHE